MSRSLLIVICDFLILSLLTLARFDKSPAAQQQQQQEQQAQQVQSIAQAARPELMDTLRQSLEAEQAEREALAQQLNQRGQALQQAQQTAEQLAQKQSVMEGEQERLERLRQQLEQERQKLASQVQDTQQQLQMTQKQREELQQNYAAAQERQRLLQEQLQKREQALKDAQEQAQQLQQQREAAERDKAVLATKLEAAGVAQQRLEGEVSTLRTEREAAQKTADTLASNVGQLAQVQQQTGQQITQQLRVSTPLSSNEIYDRFLKSRVPAGFNDTESALLGEVPHSFAPYSVLVQNDAGDIFALFEGAETPFRLDNLNDLRSVSGQLQVGPQRLDIDSVAFLKSDPRVVAVRVLPEQAKTANITPYHVEEKPLRFPSVVVVQVSGDKYGEAEPHLDPYMQGYLDIPSSVSSRLFGDFAPSRGDLVFSKNGDLIGFMVTNSKAVMLKDLGIVASMPIGRNFVRASARALQDVLQARVPAEPTTAR